MIKGWAVASRGGSMGGPNFKSQWGPKEKKERIGTFGWSD